MKSLGELIRGALDYDPLRPKYEPARSIYNAFQKEAEKRDGRTIEEFILAERTAVLEAAWTYANKNGLKEPTMEDVRIAENYAYGSVDYGSKWAHRLSQLMAEKNDD